MALPLIGSVTSGKPCNLSELFCRKRDVTHHVLRNTVDKCALQQGGGRAEDCGSGNLQGARGTLWRCRTAWIKCPGLALWSIRSGWPQLGMNYREWKTWSMSYVHDPVPSLSSYWNDPCAPSLPCTYLHQDLCIYCSLLPSS